MWRLKQRDEIKILRAGGERLAEIVAALAAAVEPDLTTLALDQLARRLISEAGAAPAFLNYQPVGVPRSAGPFPAALCVSINDEVVHGLPGSRMIKEGDLVSLDLGLKYQGLYTDMAVTVPVGAISQAAKKLLAVTKAALKLGIAASRPGGTLGDIGFAIESLVTQRGYSLVREFGGHGVGFQVHEEPEVPNYGRPDTGARLEPGLVIAIEPMVTAGRGEIVVTGDGYTVRTKDGSLAAHFEQTVLITDSGSEILTKAKV